MLTPNFMTPLSLFISLSAVQDLLEVSACSMAVSFSPLLPSPFSVGDVGCLHVNNQ